MTTVCRPLPSVERVRDRSPSRAIPALRQSTATDCGATCLAMVLAHLGRWTPVAEIRGALPSERSGQSALDLLGVARAQGLEGRGLQFDAEAVSHVRPGAILHVDGKHFVVYAGSHSARGQVQWVDLVDPARGRVRLDFQRFRQRSTGIALELWRGAGFAARSRPRGAWSRYTSMITEHPRLLLGALGCSVMLLVLSLAVPLMTKVIVDASLVPGDSPSLGLLGMAAVLVVAAQSFAAWGRGFVLVHLHERFDRRLVTAFVDRLLALPYSFFGQRTAGDLMMRLASTTAVREALTSGTISALVDGTLVIGYLGLLAYVSPSLACVAGGLAIVQLTVFLATRTRNRSLAAQMLEVQADNRGYQTRMLMGVETLKATGSEREAAEHLYRGFERVLVAARNRGVFNARVEGVSAAMRVLGPLALLLVGAGEVIRGGIDLGAMLGAAQLGLAFLIPLAALTATATQLQAVASHVDRLEDVLASAPEAHGSRHTALAQGIELRKVSFGYAPGGRVLHELDVHVRAGQHVALVGASGSGKSTMARLLLGLYLPTEGQVLFDGIPAGELDLGQLRRRLGIVPQDARLFDMTVAENIALGTPGANRCDIEAAARTAQIHDEILQLPMGYDTRLVDGGGALSGGQRQRLTLARALVRRPRLLVLDEATSALDAVTEAAVQQALEELQCMVVTIAHRLSTVVRADLILVMEQGRIVERGTHRELLAKRGRYCDLVGAQMQLGKSTRVRACRKIRETPAPRTSRRAKTACRRRRWSMQGPDR